MACDTWVIGFPTPPPPCPQPAPLQRSAPGMPVFSCLDSSSSWRVESSWLVSSAIWEWRASRVSEMPTGGTEWRSAYFWGCSEHSLSAAASSGANSVSRGCRKNKMQYYIHTKVERMQYWMGDYNSVHSAIFPNSRTFPTLWLSTGTWNDVCTEKESLYKSSESVLMGLKRNIKG